MLFNHNNNTWNIILRNIWVIVLEFSIRLEEEWCAPKERRDDPRNSRVTVFIYMFIIKIFEVIINNASYNSLLF